jgi:hypothetical protein
MHPPDISEDSWFWTILTGLGVFLGTVLVVVARAWKGFTEEKTRPAQGFILEQGELANLNDLPRTLRELSPKLDEVLATDRAMAAKNDVMRQILEANNALMLEIVQIVRRVENEDILRRRDEDRASIARAVREELRREKSASSQG